MADAMEVVEFQPGKVLFRQGDAGDKFYLIKSGCAIVSMGQGPDRQLLARVTEGGYFGERALIKSEKRCHGVHLFLCPKNDLCSFLLQPVPKPTFIETSTPRQMLNFVP